MSPNNHMCATTSKSVVHAPVNTKVKLHTAFHIYTPTVCMAAAQRACRADLLHDGVLSPMAPHQPSNESDLIWLWQALPRYALLATKL